jgi:uncharacterized membrane protein
VRVPRGLWLLAGLFVTSGTLHFVAPRRFEAIVPQALPAKRALVYASGAAELACAAGLAHPRSRGAAGLASAALLAAVLPANVQMAVDVCRRRSTAAKVAAVVRLPLQLPLMRIGWQAWRASRDGTRRCASSAQARRARTKVSSATPWPVGRSTVAASSTEMSASAPNRSLSSAGS